MGVTNDSGRLNFKIKNLNFSNWLVGTYGIELSYIENARESLTDDHLTEM